MIVDAFRVAGVAVDGMVACGGLPERNKLLMQIYADVTGLEHAVAASAQAPALGAAMFGAVAAGAAAGGHDSIVDASRAMARLSGEVYRPDPAAARGLRSALRRVRQAARPVRARRGRRDEESPQHQGLGRCAAAAKRKARSDEDESRHLGARADGRRASCPAATSRSGPASRRTQKVRRAVEGLGDLIDDYEFHYPQELSAGEPRRGARRARRPRHLLRRERPAPRPAVRQGRALARPTTRCATRRSRRTLEAVDFAGELGAHFIIWPGIEGYNYPFQTPYAEVVGAVHRRRSARRRSARRSAA